MAGDIKGKYPAASTTLTVTNLHSLAASSTWITGWGSASINNTSNVDFTYLVGGTFTTASANRQIGTIEVWVLSALNDTPTWFTPASGTLGTEGAVAFTAREQLVSIGRLLASIATTATNGEIYAFPPTDINALFAGMIPPPYWCLFVTQNCATTTSAGLAASGNAIYYTPVIAQYT